jgi:transcriptional regulator with XRE-family HTH domain
MKQEVYMSLLRLGNLLRERRGGRGVRDVATEIGVSAATLSRVEGGKLPDLLTFRKLCTWLKVDPAEILEISDEKTPLPTPAPAAAVHLRADVLLSPEAAGDLAHLILAAQRELARRAREQQTDVSTWF